MIKAGNMKKGKNKSYTYVRNLLYSLHVCKCVTLLHHKKIDSVYVQKYYIYSKVIKKKKSEEEHTVNNDYQRRIVEVS